MIDNSYFNAINYYKVILFMSLDCDKSIKLIYAYNLYIIN